MYYGYDNELSKLDPLVAVHVKVPKSVLAALRIEGRRERRYPAEIARQIIVDWEKRTRAEREDAAVEVPAGTGKRKKA